MNRRIFGQIVAGGLLGTCLGVKAEPKMTVVSYKKCEAPISMEYSENGVPTIWVGDETHPATPEDIATIQEQLSMVCNDPNLTLTLGHFWVFNPDGTWECRGWEQGN